jgi:hypothetical protein
VGEEMTIVLTPTPSQKRWAIQREPIAKEHITSPSPNDYYVYYTSKEQKMFWLGYLAGYRKREEEV